MFCTTKRKYTSYKVVKFRVTVVSSWGKLALSAAHVCKLSFKKLLIYKRECMNKCEIYAQLINLFPMQPFSNPQKTSKTLWCSDVFRGLRKVLEKNGLDTILYSRAYLSFWLWRLLFILVCKKVFKNCFQIPFEIKANLNELICLYCVWKDQKSQW